MKYFTKILTITMMIGCLSFSTFAKQPYAYETQVNVATKILNSTGSSNNLKLFLSTFLTKEEDRTYMQKFFSQIPDKTPIPKVVSKGNKIYIGDGTTPWVIEDAKRGIYSYNGKMWQYSNSTSVEQDIKNLETILNVSTASHLWISNAHANPMLAFKIGAAVAWAFGAFMTMIVTGNSEYMDASGKNPAGGFTKTWNTLLWPIAIGVYGFGNQNEGKDIFFLQKIVCPKDKVNVVGNIQFHSKSKQGNEILTAIEFDKSGEYFNKLDTTCMTPKRTSDSIHCPENHFMANPMGLLERKDSRTLKVVETIPKEILREAAKQIKSICDNPEMRKVFEQELASTNAKMKDMTASEFQKETIQFRTKTGIDPNATH